MLVFGFVGFGEAAYSISEGLLHEGVDKIIAYDAFENDPSLGKAIHERAKRLNIRLVGSLEDLIARCSVIICATSAKVAEKIANNAKRYLTRNHLYIDINAASSMVKQNISNHINETGAKFVDGAVMGSIPLNKHKTPIYLSGNGAHSFLDIGSRYGMNLSYISESPGSSSAIKMFRSIFMKGLSVLLWETLESSSQYGVLEQVLESINQSISGKSIEQIADTLLPRTAIHAERRVSEMSEVIKMLESMEVDGILARSIQHKLRKIASFNLKENFNNEAPEHYDDVLNALKKIDRGCDERGTRVDF